MAQAEFVLKPNVKKVIMLNVGKVVLAVIVILGLIFYFSTLVDLSIFGDVFALSENELPKLSEVILNFSVGVVIAALLASLISYLSVSKREYMFFQDRMEKYTNFLIFNVNKIVIPLNNIARVRVEKNTNDHLLRTGTVVLDLTGLEMKEIKLEYLDDAEKCVPYIQQLIDNTRAKFGMQYQFNQTIGDTLDRL